MIHIEQKGRKTMTNDTHESLMPLYLIGGVAIIGGVFWLLNKNINKVSNAIADNKTIQTITDPVGVIDKAAYSVGYDFWEWYDKTVTDPYLDFKAALGLYTPIQK
jgi:hypothetical protein